MTPIVLYTIIVLSIIGVLAAVLLYFVAQKFKVFEDPRIDEVEAILPGANCGGCGYAGCRNFADAIVKNDDISSLFCPVGGNSVMAVAANIAGKAAPEKEPEVAVIRCTGYPENRPRTNQYDGAATCAIAHNLYIGEGGCPYGCLGFGDCVTACTFDAIQMNYDSHLPEVIDDKCTACGACVKACPRNIIELRKKRPDGKKIFVSCVNEEKGALAKKYCKATCLGCTKCFKVCEDGAITMKSNLAYIDSYKCTLCGKCVDVCPANKISRVNFPIAEKIVKEHSKISGEDQ